MRACVCVFVSTYNTCACVSAFVCKQMGQHYCIHELRFGLPRAGSHTQPSLDWIQPYRQPTGSGLSTRSHMVPMLVTTDEMNCRDFRYIKKGEHDPLHQNSLLDF